MYVHCLPLKWVMWEHCTEPCLQPFVPLLKCTCRPVCPSSDSRCSTVCDFPCTLLCSIHLNVRADLFASQVGHVGALYGAFLAMMMASGSPPTLAAMSLGCDLCMYEYVCLHECLCGCGCNLCLLTWVHVLVWVWVWLWVFA
jgi:hypothetical protein